MIKKVIILLFLILVMNIIIFTFSSEKDMPIFNYLENTDNDHDIYVLSFANTNLNTSNFIDYFRDFNIQILGIYPKLNPLYENKVQSKLKYYSFEKSNLNSNLNKFIAYYLSILSDLGLNEERDKIYLNGIKISKVKIYASHHEILRLMKRYSKVTFS